MSLTYWVDEDNGDNVLLFDDAINVSLIEPEFLDFWFFRWVHKKRGGIKNLPFFLAFYKNSDIILNMNFNTAYLLANQVARKEKVSMIVVLEGIHRDEHAPEDSHGFCPASAVSMLYRFGKVVAMIPAGGTRRSAAKLDK